jgi:hypothetical protein
MRCLLPVAILLGFALPAFCQPPPPPASIGASAAATQEIETRRKHLQAMGVWDTMPPAPLKEADVAKALTQLEAALRSRDPHVYTSAVHDLSNSQYRGFAPKAILKLALPCLHVPETEQQRVTAQGLLMEHLARRYGPTAKDALPDLLRIVTDVKAHAYLRGQAIDAAARIAPGDKAVVDAFIDAALKPEPQHSSGVHERIAERLGDMGKAAWPAKAALLKIRERGAWYEDYAVLALGKLALDDTPRPLEDYLDRLAAVDRIPLEQAAAAFIHIQKACLPGAAVRPPHHASLQPFQVNVEQVLRELDRKRAERARPVLLKLIADRAGGDIFVRSALRTLAIIGPGSSPEAARVLVTVLTAKPLAVTAEARLEAQSVLCLFEPADKAAVVVLADGLNRLVKDEPHEWLSRCDLAQVIGRFGKDARPAVPALIRALDRFKSPATIGRYPAYEEMGACVDALAAAGGDVPGARAVVLHLLDADAPLLRNAGPADASVQAHLLLALGKMGLPSAGEERDAVLDRLRGGLGRDQTLAFNAAAKAVVRNGASFTAMEAKTLVPWLVRVVSGESPIKSDPGGSMVPLDFTYEEGMIGPCGFAARALGAMGKLSRDALPALAPLAEQPLVDVKGTYRAEPAMNFVIREARKAVEAIR